MTWFKVDDSFYAAREVFDAPDCAIALWVRAGCWSARNRTCGFIPFDATGGLCDDPRRAVRELVRRGIWDRVEGGYRQSKGPVASRPWWRTAYDDKRPPIPDETRHLVYERDGFKCIRCGATDDLSLDHIWPWSRGGADTEDNLQTLCRSCNSKKGAHVLCLAATGACSRPSGMTTTSWPWPRTAG